MSKSKFSNKAKRKLVIPRISATQRTKSEQAHKSLKDYNRAQAKKEMREILKETKNPAG